jgi:Holliday junction resolvase RusA-like endonuclease
MKIEFRLEIDPPTATAQEKQVRVVCGHPQFYEKPAAKEAKKLQVHPTDPKNTVNTSADLTDA